MRRNLGAGRQDGMTLIEIMIVIAILGLLAAIVGVNVMQSLNDGRIGAAQTQIQRFKTGLKLYNKDCAKYPSTASAVFAPTTPVSSSREARRTPARLPNATSSALRRRGPMPGTLSSSERRSRIDLALR